MSWLDGLSKISGWIASLFFYIALLIITPWLLALLYDLLLYTWRSLTHEIPYIGGRARGRRPPRAPTLLEHTAAADTPTSLAGDDDDDTAGETAAAPRRRTPPVELAGKVVGEVARGAAVVAATAKDAVVSTAASAEASGNETSADEGVAVEQTLSPGRQNTLRRTKRQVSRSPR